MKKILTAIVLFVFALLPMSVMAMQSITDNELSAVTGQAGVSINIDATANLSIGSVAWGDSNGITQAIGTYPAGTFGQAGYVGLSNLNLNVHLSGRHDAGVFDGLNYVKNDPITIDVGSTSATGTTLVRIGLPTLHIQLAELSSDVFVSGVNAGAPTSTSAQVLGSLYLGDVEILMGQYTGASDYTTYDAGYVTIGAAGAGNVGVNMGLNVKIDKVSIGTLSWGNAVNLIAHDAGTTTATMFHDYTSAGYIGLRNFTLDEVTIVGGVAIGIGTLDFDSAGGTSAGTLGTHTQVNIAIKNGTFINVGSAITGTVLLAQNNLLTTGAETLGNFYLQGLRVTVSDNAATVGGMTNEIVAKSSLVQIWAH